MVNSWLSLSDDVVAFAVEVACVVPVEEAPNDNGCALFLGTLVSSKVSRDYCGYDLCEDRRRYGVVGVSDGEGVRRRVEQAPPMAFIAFAILGHSSS